MTWNDAFTTAAGAAAVRLDPVQLETLADRIAAGGSDQVAAEAVPVSGFAETVGPLLAARRAGGVSDPEAAAFLRGLAAGRRSTDGEVRVESVWTGPSTHPVPVRATAQVLGGVIAQATGELFLMTYSAAPFRPVLDALADAVGRGVRVEVVVETLQGAGSALSGAEPASAFATVDGVQLWHWPTEQRADRGAKMHAKLAVADRNTLLVSSANLTQSGADRNLEAGVLIHGGTAPVRAAEHVAELMARGVLTRLRRGGG